VTEFAQYAAVLLVTGADPPELADEEAAALPDGTSATSRACAASARRVPGRAVRQRFVPRSTADVIGTHSARG
jgi:hypothetical protein